MKGLIKPRPLTKPPAPRAAPTGPRILVVDDDPDMRALLHLQLEHAGYRVLTAEDAVAAGHALEQGVPDLIIADFKMPYMSGVEFIGALRSDAALRKIPVIFMTGMHNASELVGKTFGFPLLTKPLSVDDLLPAVEAELGAHRAPPR